MGKTEFSQTYKLFIVLNSRILVNSYFTSEGTNLVTITIADETASNRLGLCDLHCLFYRLVSTQNVVY